mmetsp:Transcript_970/g.2120  ORF Transcript_970/g.2120 Transcript_970/m.2120 type:complete len:99 (-) Transcript_970:895-1191(-)
MWIVYWKECNSGGGTGKNTLLMTAVITLREKHSSKLQRKLLITTRNAIRLDRCILLRITNFKRRGNLIKSEQQKGAEYNTFTLSTWKYLDAMLTAPFL